MVELAIFHSYIYTYVVVICHKILGGRLKLGGGRIQGLAPLSMNPVLLIFATDVSIAGSDSKKL